MGNTRNTGYLQKIVQYDASNNITLPANLTVTGSITGYATTSYVTTQISNLVNGAPGALDTLNELAAALGNDASFAATLTTSLSGKQASLSGTGFVKISGTTISYDNSTYLTTGSASSTYLPLAGGTLTGALSGTSATFSSSVQATQFNAVNDRNYLARGAFRITSATNNASTLDISVTDTTTSIYSNYYSGGNDNTIIIGTYANLSNQLVLKPSGNIGIGTASPVGALHIYSSNQNMASTAATSYTNAKFRLEPFNTSNVGISMGLISPNINYIQSSYNEGTTSPLTINPFGGNVGIGTSTIGSTLQVNGSAAIGYSASTAAPTNGLKVATDIYVGSNTGGPSMQVFGGTSSNTIGSSAYITIQDVTNTRFWGFQADASQKLNFWHYNGGWSSVANISPTGAATFACSVSIGGADQGYQLDVKRTSTGDSTFDTVANFYKASTHNTGLLLRLKNTIVDLAANNITGGGGPTAGMSFSVSSGGTISTALTIASTGAACFACELTAKTLGTNDLLLNNLNYECANYVDGTRGSWLIQEGACDLFIINQVSCKKYKFNLIEIK
jgi:hypothetical protein